MSREQPDLRLEVEVQSLDECDEALAAGADIILVDNMSLADVREAVRRTAGRAKIEILGWRDAGTHSRSRRPPARTSCRPAH
ncbi:MAG: hypothetical protein QM736_12985 [Vicinamibacterales bacterium]